MGGAGLGAVRAVGGVPGHRRARQRDHAQLPGRAAGLAVNVVLLLVLVPRLGIAGAGIALCGAYVAMIAVMHLLTRRLFAVGVRVAPAGQLALVMGGIAAAGDLLLPTHGAVGFLARAAVLAAIPAVLLGTGFAHRQELEQARLLLTAAARRRAREPA